MKTKNIIIAGLAGLLLAACTEDVVEKKQAMDSYKPMKIEVADGVTDAVTRADYSGFPSTTFETGDAIGIYAFDGSSYVTSNIRFVKQSDGSWLPDEEVPYVEDYTYYAYFPYREDTYPPSTSGTVNDVDTKFESFISDVSNYFWKADQSTKANFTYSNLMIAKGMITDADDDAVTIKFTMEHKRGLAVFGEDAADAIFRNNIPCRIESTIQFLMKPETTTSFWDDTGIYTLEAPAGEYVTHNVIIPGTDLSMVDNAGNPRASRTTANCYLVHAAGNYKIPLVYGNAIKNGEDNAVAYAPGGSTTDTYCANFVNNYDNNITGPWITKSTSGTGVNKGMGLTAVSAELLWQDKSGLISNVAVSGNFLKFTVSSFGGGNALIAVKDNTGFILWSWHIWATEDDLSNTTVVATGSHNYTVAPVNLGWVPTGDSGKQGYCPYYQWGRKDPFIPASAYNSSTNHTVYNIGGATITGISYLASTTITIGTCIRNPTCHYYNSSTSGPITTTYYNMWDAQNTTTNNVTSATKKTIYDPCPPGFCVPTYALCEYIGGIGLGNTMSTWNYTNNGATWNTGITGDALWFPATGTRSYNSSSVSYVGSRGQFWIATPYSTLNGYGMALNSSKWYMFQSERATECGVRPVAEE